MTELEKLKKYLDDKGYDSEWNNVISENDQIIVFNGVARIRSWDAVCHPHSYGGMDGLLEIYGSLCTDVIGWLTADDVIKILEYKYNKGTDFIPIDTMSDIEGSDNEG